MISKLEKAASFWEQRESGREIEVEHFDFNMRHDPRHFEYPTEVIDIDLLLGEWDTEKEHIEGEYKRRKDEKAKQEIKELEEPQSIPMNETQKKIRQKTKSQETLIGLMYQMGIKGSKKKSV